MPTWRAPNRIVKPAGKTCKGDIGGIGP
jgi:hypothetical protein